MILPFDLPMEPSATMRGHSFPHRLGWQKGDEPDEYGVRQYGPLIRVPCRLEVRDSRSRLQTGDHDIAYTQAHLCKDVGALLTDRFTIDSGALLECHAVIQRDGFQTLRLGIQSPRSTR